MLSPAPKQFDRRDHSNTQALVPHSSERAPHRERPRPNGILSSHSSPVLAALLFGLRSARAPLPQDVSDPKIAALGGQESAPTCSRSVISSRTPELVPKQPEHAGSYQCNAQEIAPLRKTPVDNPVKLETAATAFAAHLDRHRRQRQIRSNLLAKA